MGLKIREARPAVIICIDMKEAKTTAPVLTYTHTEAHAICLSADRPDSRAIGSYNRRIFYVPGDLATLSDTKAMLVPKRIYTHPSSSESSHWR